MNLVKVNVDRYVNEVNDHLLNVEAYLIQCETFVLQK